MSNGTRRPAAAAGLTTTPAATRLTAPRAATTGPTRRNAGAAVSKTHQNAAAGMRHSTGTSLTDPASCVGQRRSGKRAASQTRLRHRQTAGQPLAALPQPPAIIRPAARSHSITRRRRQKKRRGAPRSKTRLQCQQSQVIQSQSMIQNMAI